MDVNSSKTYRCLETKAQILGFEIFDILLISSAISAGNLLVPDVPFKFFLSWGPAVLLALVLRFGKRGKPDHYLVHWIRFQFSPRVYLAFKESSFKWKKTKT